AAALSRTSSGGTLRSRAGRAALEPAALAHAGLRSTFARFGCGTGLALRAALAECGLRSGGTLRSCAGRAALGPATLAHAGLRSTLAGFTGRALRLALTHSGLRRGWRRGRGRPRSALRAGP